MSEFYVDARRLYLTTRMPEQHTEDASGFDLHAHLPHGPLHLKRGDIGRIPTGVAFAIPKGYEGLVRGRSSVTLKGFDVKLGTIDADFRGEVHVIYYAARKMVIEDGDRIAQIVFSAVVSKVRLRETDQLSATVRGEGGFGSTGR